MSRYVATRGTVVVLGSVLLTIVAISIAGPMTAARAQEEAPDGVVNDTRIDATVACAGATPPEAIGLRSEGLTELATAYLEQSR